MVTKPDKICFRKRMTAFLEDVGKPSKIYDYVVETKGGPLRVAIYSGEEHHEWEPWVACRFDFPKRGLNVAPNCNPFSGKWNFHCSKRVNLDDFYAHVSQSIDKILLHSDGN